MPTSIAFEEADKIVLTEDIIWAERNFHEIISIPLVKGSVNDPLKEVNSFLLCESAAKELFGGTMVEQIDMGLDDHDRLIAYVLGLSHALNIAFFTALGMTRGCRSISLTLLRSLVTPAMSLKLRRSRT